jgi:L,D-peptidoglycan transpeptidase YkuD (ErfK/YbiS/YcfS/YnhG family)
MKVFLFAVCIVSTLFPFSSKSQNVSATTKTEKALDDSRQLLIVLTKDWNAVPGTLFRLERSSTNSQWKIKNSHRVVVGRNGLGWGLGLHGDVTGGPVKKEGDGKSPAGVFRLSSAFGLIEPSKLKNLKIPYFPLTDQIECVDDVKSAHYNAIVERNKVPTVDWNSSEKMQKYTKEYHLGVVVDHNINPRQSACGSCIFLHVWKGPESSTSGCTAMGLSNMEKVVRWLDVSKNPILVQLPVSEYDRLKTEWGLPEAKVSLKN